MQLTLGITPDGIVDEESWNVMYNAYLGIIERIPNYYTVNTSAPFGGVELRRGSESEAVLHLQQYLNDISTVYPEITHMSQSGYFGNRTQEAVIAVQRLLNLTSDGKVDALTWDKIASLHNNLYQGMRFIPGRYPGYDIGEDEGSWHYESFDAVRYIQKLLRNLPEYALSVPIDGIYERATREAVKEFQRDNGLYPTGIVDIDTWDMLYEVSKNKVMLPKFLSVFPCNTENYEMGSGDDSPITNVLQCLLQELERDFNFNSPVRATGEYDEQTENAVKVFQGQNMLPVSGRVDVNTWNRIVVYYNMMQNEYSQ